MQLKSAWLPHLVLDRQNRLLTLDLSGCRFRADSIKFGQGRYEVRCWLGLAYFDLRLTLGVWAKMTPLWWLLALLLIGAGLQTTEPESSQRPPARPRTGDPLVRRVEVAPWTSPRPPGFTAAVLASYYHPGLVGLPMANLELYGRDEMVAASNDLPIGSWVMVCRGDLCCEMEIGDRGPFPDPADPRHGSRAIDLGERPARELGIIDQGVATVTIHPLPGRAKHPSGL